MHATFRLMLYINQYCISFSLKDAICPSLTIHSCLNVCHQGIKAGRKGFGDGLVLELFHGTAYDKLHDRTVIHSTHSSCSGGPALESCLGYRIS
jgi:hypothetical protein